MKKLSEQGLTNKRKLIQRAYIVAAALVVMALAVATKLVRVQFFETYRGKTWKEYSKKHDIRVDSIKATRGNIYSSDSSLLATSLPFYYLGLDTKTASSNYFAEHIDELARLLSKSFGRTPEYHKNRIIEVKTSKEKRYLRLSSKDITHLGRNKVLQWPFFRKEKGGGGGVLETEYRRYKPFSPMADRTIGGLNAETNKGFIGLEASFDKQLAGKNGMESVEVVEGGQTIPIGDDNYIRPEPGNDLYTTLDINIQDVAESSLKSTLEKFSADYGCAVVMEVATGEIKAIANLTRRGTNYIEDKNYALVQGTDPGSTFKLVTMAAILEHSKMEPKQEWVNTGNGRIIYRGKPINDAKNGGFGNITAQQVIEKSSNIGIHLLTMKYFGNQPKAFSSYMDRFRLRSTTGLHMKGEAQPYIKTPDKWDKRTLSTMSYGYEMRLSPIQTLAFYNAVANDGHWVRPMVVKEIRSGDKVIEHFEPYRDSQPLFSERTAKKLRNMLEGVVENGGSKNIFTPHYKIAGKTGTARRLINGSFREGKYFTSFVGYFPADKPKYSCIVIVDTPKGDRVEQLYAGKVAGPVFKAIADRIYATDLSLHRQTRPESKKEPSGSVLAGSRENLQQLVSQLGLTQLPESSSPWLYANVFPKGKVEWKNRNIDKDDAPDLTGLPLRDALFLMENKGYRVSFKGQGKVTSQSVLPDQKKILLTLN